MSTPTARASREWLALREPTDATSRSVELAEHLAARLTAPLVVHDLGAGTGSMRRWLAPRLPGPQLWVEHDRDAELLDRDEPPTRDRGGQPVEVVTRCDDLATTDDLQGAGLVTASALLDVLTAQALENLVDLVVAAAVPCLLTTSVVGRVELQPPDPLDAQIAGAFNDHQRRATDIGVLLGPDAVDRAAQMFAGRGWTVLRESSPWQLGPDNAALLTEWLFGWVGAASEQDAGLELQSYLSWRLHQIDQGSLRARIHHVDLLAWPA